jgi:hypothetical protein
MGFAEKKRSNWPAAKQSERDCTMAILVRCKESLTFESTS